MAKKKQSVEQSTDATHDNTSTANGVDLSALAVEEVKKHHSLIKLAIAVQLAINTRKKEMDEKQTDIDEQQATVADQLMRVAFSYCSEAKGTINFDCTKFLNWCEQQEAWAKSDEAAPNKVDSIPRVWTQGKSNIKRAWEDFKLAPLTHDETNGNPVAKTERSLRDELNAARKAKKDKENRGTLTVAGGEKIAERFRELYEMYKSVDTPEGIRTRMVEELDDLIDDLKATLSELVGDDVAGRKADQAAKEAEQAAAHH